MNLNESLNCIFLNRTNQTLNFTNCSFKPTDSNFANNSNDDENVSIEAKIFVYTILAILCCFLTLLFIFFCFCIFDSLKESLSEKIRSVKNCFKRCFICLKTVFCLKKERILTYNQNKYQFSVKDCTIIKPNEIDQSINLQTECPICMDSLINLTDPKKQQDILMINKCNHKFHTDCIYPWFNTRFMNEQPLDCPLCRTEIDQVVIKIPMENTYNYSSDSSYDPFDDY